MSEPGYEFRTYTVVAKVVAGSETEDPMDVLNRDTIMFWAEEDGIRKEAIELGADPALWSDVEDSVDDVDDADNVWTCPGCGRAVEPSDVRRHATECDKYDGRYGY